MNIRHLNRAPALLLLLLLGACSGTSNIGLQPGPGNNGGGIDNELPVFTDISGVSQGASLSGSVAIAATATDNKGVVSFTLKLDGSQLASSSTGSLSYTWDTTAQSNGEHTVLFSAGDLAGNVATRSFTVSVSNGGGGGGGGQLGKVSGKVYAPNGVDPISQALVYIVANSSAGPGGVPIDTYTISDMSEPDGSFELSGITPGARTIVLEKGAFNTRLNYTVQAGDNALPANLTTLSADDASSMLVVTGQYDVIENVLAKLGLGDVDAGGNLVLGTEQFDLVDGAGKLPDADYDNFDEFFATPDNFDNYRTIFLNCGNNYEDAFFADAAARAKLLSWVNAGGRLYCTDWSYDFCEQLWPEQVSFEAVIGDPDGLGSTPGERDVAQLGASMDLVDGIVGDAFLKSWLTGRSATNASQGVDIVDWLPAWSAMHEVGPDVKVWVSGEVQFGFPATSATLPLTISFDSGEGSVLYSSYHTEETATTELTPQDRVLQYLIFEIL